MRTPSEDEIAEYREEAARIRYEREQARKRVLDPRDPDYIAPNEEEFQKWEGFECPKNMC